MFRKLMSLLSLLALLGGCASGPSYEGYVTNQEQARLERAAKAGELRGDADRAYNEAARYQAALDRYEYDLKQDGFVLGRDLAYDCARIPETFTDLAATPEKYVAMKEAACYAGHDYTLDRLAQEKYEQSYRQHAYPGYGQSSSSSVIGELYQWSLNASARTYHRVPANNVPPTQAPSAHFEWKPFNGGYQSDQTWTSW